MRTLSFAASAVSAIAAVAQTGPDGKATATAGVSDIVARPHRERSHESKVCR
jgi:hypothetical protein